MSVTVKYNRACAKLHTKLQLSITPVPGFVVGLSGTDSIVAFMMLYRACGLHFNKYDLKDKLIGVHFVLKKRKRPSWFEEHIIPWLRQNFGYADIRVVELEENDEVNRFAAIQRISKDETRWVAWPVNATEVRLGKYTILAKAASIWPIDKFWKSEILELCKEMQVPSVALEMSRLPDCLCGRDELAAENIELIDDLIRFNPIDFTKHDVDLVNTLMAWIKDQKKEFGFKERTPYTL